MQYFTEKQEKVIVTIKLIKIQTPKKNCYNYRKTGTVSFYYRVMGPKDAVGIANSVDLDQEQSDLDLHCLPRPICLKTWDNYGMCFLSDP